MAIASARWTQWLSTLSRAGDFPGVVLAARGAHPVFVRGYCDADRVGHLPNKPEDALQTSDRSTRPSRRSIPTAPHGSTPFSAPSIGVCGSRRRVGALALLLTMVVARSTVRPLEELRRATTALAAGARDQRVR